MAKSYFSFEKRGSFGEISGIAGSLFSSDDKSLICATTSTLGIWNIRKNSLSKKLDFSNTITCMISKATIALGFKDGHISVHTFSDTVTNTFEGHDSSISAFCYSSDSLTLYSGSFDTTIIIWDLVGDCAIRRLQGHRDAITDLFIENSLFSCSRDKMIKEWEIEMCVNTLICPGEIWGIKKYNKRLYAASEKFIRIWEENKEIGVLERGDIKRCKQIEVEKGLVLTCSVQRLEIWRIRGEKENEKKLKRRRKRNRDNDCELQLPDQYEKIISHKSTEKISGFSISNNSYKSKTHENQVFISISYSSNKIELYSLAYNAIKNLKIPADFSLTSSISHEGHRSPSRTLALSEDNHTLLSGAGESIKIWDVATEKCVVHIESGYCLCSAWFPGDKYVMVGCRNGEIQIFDVLSSEKVVNKQAHAGSVWSCHLQGQVLITGGADFALKWWNLRIPTENSKIALKCFESILLKDEILCIRSSPCLKYICAALLDSTIQVLYSDSKKMLFSLYAHKLPVTSFDISYDSLLLVSGSSDKNLKVWGMDFGDCHKSIIAHSLPITDVKCIPGTHFCISSGRDFLIKYWDLDSKDIIQVLKGHASEVWSICISSQGDFFISTGNDYSFIIWTQTDTQLFISEQKEIEIENNVNLEDLGLHKSKKESCLLAHTSADALKSGEALIEALEICIQFKEHLANGGSSIPPPHFAGKDQYAYILKNLCMIPPQYLDSVMHILPYNYALELFDYLEHYLDKGVETEIVAKTVSLLLRVHENSLVSSIFGNEHWYKALDRIKEKLMKRTKEYRDLIGRNIAAAKIILKEIS